MAKVLITGASGFIGSNLVNVLLERGERVTCLTRSKTKMPPEHNNVRWLIADLLNPDTYRDVLGRSDYVFHLAGVINARRVNDYYKGNVECTERLLETCLENATKVKRFILMSSIAAMGPGNTDDLIRESDNCHPHTEYGKSKRQAEVVADDFKNVIPITILRPSFVYGIGDIRGAQFLRSIITSASSPYLNSIKTISICNVKDVVQACLLSMNYWNIPGSVYLISDGMVYTWKEIFNTLLNMLNDFKQTGLIDDETVYRRLFQSLSRVFSQIKLLPRGGQYWGCDIIRARNDLNFSPTVGLDKGAKETVSHYLRNGLLEV